MTKRIIKNLILYVLAFIFSIYLHTGTVSFEGNYDLYLGVFIFSWGLSGLLSRKFKIWKNSPFLDSLYAYTISFFLMLGTLALIFYKFNMMEVSRAIISYSLLSAYFCEIAILLYTNRERLKLEKININYSGMAFFFEVNLFEIISFLICYFISKTLSPGYDSTVLFICLSLCWFTGSFLGHHFSLSSLEKNYLTFIWKYLKTYIIITALALFSAFITRLESSFLGYIFYGVFLYSLISFMGATFYYYIKKHRRLVLNLAGFPFKGEFGDVLLNEKIGDIQNYRSDFNTRSTEVLQEQLRNLSLKRFPEIYEFVDKSLDLGSFDSSYSLILKSDSVLNFEYLPDSTLQLFINLQELNGVHSMNDYLAGINNKLKINGVFVGNFESVYLRHTWFFENYPYYFAQLFYFFDFLWNRLFSKIAFFRSIYKAFMGNTNKALSLAEGLGRIYYCGFEVLHLKIINNRMFFIARKKEAPSNGKLPSSGILFRMKRLGKNGEQITVYKIRTMHPYAEYIQGFVYDNFKLQEGGKLNNDFRITYWGKILRKMWIDELPMIYNWLKGDLKLVGCRPLSKQFYDLYSEELKNKRIGSKPGLIPPFYADNPKSLDEIMKSEEKYLDEFETSPFKTDLKYFIKCLRNILLKGMRSS